MGVVFTARHQMQGECAVMPTLPACTMTTVRLCTLT